MKLKETFFREKAFYVIFSLLIVIVHGILVFRAFPYSAIKEGNIPTYGNAADTTRYFASIWSVVKTSRLIGYEPYYMAGYPFGLWNSIGKKGYEIIAFFSSIESVKELFYLTVVLVSFISPLLLWGVISFITGKKKILFLFLLIFLWHCEAQISYFWRNGIAFFPMGLCLVTAIFYITVMVFEKGYNILPGIFTGIISGIVFYIHTACIVPLLLGELIIFICYRKELLKNWRFFILAFLGFVLIAVWWFVPLVKYYDICIPEPKLWWRASWKNLLVDFFSDRVYRHHFDRNFIFQSFIILGTFGVWFVLAQRCFKCLWVIFLAVLIFVYVGNYIPFLRSVQPYRYRGLGILILSLPVSYAIRFLWDGFNKFNEVCRYSFVTILLILLPSFTSNIFDLFYYKGDRFGSAKYKKVFDIISRHNNKGRVLTDFEELGHLIPIVTGRPVLGGLSQQAFLKYRMAGAEPEIFAGYKLNEISGEKLYTLLKDLSVALIVVRFNTWKTILDSWPQFFKFGEDVDSFRIYYVNNPDVTYVFNEGGEAELVDHRYIKVKSKSSEVIIKYHYVDWLKADKGVKLSSYPWEKDELGFIKAVLPDDVREFTIYLQPDEIDEDSNSQ